MVQLASEHYASETWRVVAVGVHEAGHAVAGRALGLKAEIAQVRPSGGWCEVSGHELQHEHVRRGTALAGAVATHLSVYGVWKTGDDELIRCISSDCLSISDRILAGPFGPADIRHCASSVRALWQSIVDEAAVALASALKK